jgi:hypothetical protein
MYAILNSYVTLLALTTLGEKTKTEMIPFYQIAQGGKASRGGIVLVRIHGHLYHEHHQCV